MNIKCFQANIVRISGMNLNNVNGGTNSSKCNYDNSRSSYNHD